MRLRGQHDGHAREGRLEGNGGFAGLRAVVDDVGFDNDDGEGLALFTKEGALELHGGVGEVSSGAENGAAEPA